MGLWEAVVADGSLDLNSGDSWELLGDWVILWRRRPNEGEEKIVVV